MTDTASTNALPSDKRLDWCYDAVQGVSRTFAITIDMLNEPMARRICVGYLLCRIPDTIEDTPRIPADEKATLLQTFDAVLDPADDTTVDDFMDAVTPWIPAPDNQADEWEADWAVVEHTPRILRTFNDLDDEMHDAIRPPVRELVHGMEKFVARYANEEGVRIQTIDELEEYCYYVAGTVGHLITNIDKRTTLDEMGADRLATIGENFGMLLQLVNIAKDVHDDYHTESNIYLPADWLNEEGVPQDDLLDPEHRAGTVAVVQRVIDHARQYIEAAQEYSTLPKEAGNTVGAWAVPYLLAVGTFRELQERPVESLESGAVKVSREEVYALIDAFDSENPPDVSDLREHIVNQPYTG